MYDFTLQLLSSGGVEDREFERVVERFGEEGAVDLIGLVGFSASFHSCSMLIGIPSPEASNRSRLSKEGHRTVTFTSCCTLQQSGADAE